MKEINKEFSQKVTERKRIDNDQEPQVGDTELRTSDWEESCCRKSLGKNTLDWRKSMSKSLQMRKGKPLECSRNWIKVYVTEA